MKRILIVDDAATVRLYHRQVLESAHYEVEEAVNGIEALEKALVKPYDLLLVDINMPKLDGYGFLRELRKQGDYQPPAIMISTEASAQDRVQAFVAGANYYLVKPIQPHELLSYCHVLLA